MTEPDSGLRPLADIRVLSVTVYLSGPFLSMTLARFGADVIKIEAPGGGDPVRNVGPYAGPDGVSMERQTPDDLSVRFLKRSEGVKSVTLNLKAPEGKGLFLDLAKQSDVVLENLSPGTMNRLGVGYDAVSAVNPKIVYCSISGYGQTGPNKDSPAHDHQIQAMSGVMDMNGAADGPPTRVGVFIGDLVTPLYAAYSILAALRHRDQTGRGQYLDASMIDAVTSMMFVEPVEHALSAGMSLRSGNDSRQGVTGLYRLKDGDVIITVGTEDRWRGLCAAVHAEHLLSDPLNATAEGRDARTPELRKALQDAFARMTCDDAVTRLEAAGVPAAKVRTLPDVLADSDVHARGAIKPARRAGADAPAPDTYIPGFPIRFSDGPLVELEGSAPLGRHTDDVLERLLGLDADTREALRAKGII